MGQRPDDRPDESSHFKTRSVQICRMKGSKKVMILIKGTILQELQQNFLTFCHIFTMGTRCFYMNASCVVRGFSYPSTFTSEENANIPDILASLLSLDCLYYKAHLLQLAAQFNLRHQSGLAQQQCSHDFTHQSTKLQSFISVLQNKS